MSARNGGGAASPPVCWPARASQAGVRAEKRAGGPTRPIGPEDDELGLHVGDLPLYAHNLFFDVVLLRRPRLRVRLEREERGGGEGASLGIRTTHLSSSARPMRATAGGEGGRGGGQQIAATRPHLEGQSPLGRELAHAE